MTQWQPSATLAALQKRAAVNYSIRSFFAERHVMEVETPLLMQATAAEPHLQNFHIAGRALQTSPESAMKRLLCAGSGPIYQLCKAFRLGEQGRRHNPEFTMLEWYQPDYSFTDMIDETLALIQSILGEKSVETHRYADVFRSVTGLNPHTATINDLKTYADAHIDGVFDDMTVSDWLDLIMSQCVEPQFDPTNLTVITEFPACQAALAKTSLDTMGNAIAQRFEVYSGGLELANGYDELCDPTQLDEVLDGNDALMLAAFQTGTLQQCCGVALGVDRLLMLTSNTQSLSDVLAFDYSRA